MKELKKRITFINIVSNFILQVITIISGFIIPKFILIYFGSEVNGLISSLNQFLSYITLIEGGITGVIVAALYNPLINGDNKEISSIINTTNSFYRKIGLIYIVYSVIVAILYPFIFDSPFSFGYIFSLTLILSLSLFIQYTFSLSLRNLLNADKKVYIVSFTQSIIIILNIILSYISLRIFPSIHIFKLINSILFIIQPLVFNHFINKYYCLDKSAEKSNKLLKSRWNGFAINMAAFIHFSTDVTILTIFTNLATVSIYSVYALVTSGLRSIINSICSAINPTIGQTYARGNKKELNDKLDLYEYIVFILVFFSFALAGLLITPFVMVYTKGINDANYNQLLFGILLVISEAIYLIKFPHLNLAYSANKFKELTKPAFIEATINIIISLVLVNIYGLIGVAIGTICGMTYRMIQQVGFTRVLIPDRSQRIFYKKLFIFIITTAIGLALCVIFVPTASFNILSWVIHALIYSCVFVVLYLLISVFFFNNEFRFIKKYLFRKDI